MVRTGGSGRRGSRTPLPSSGGRWIQTVTGSQRRISERGAGCWLITMLAATSTMRVALTILSINSLRDGVSDAHVFGGELNRRAQLWRPRSWRAPIIAVIVPARMFETGAKKGCARHIGVSRHSKVDVERTPGFLRVNLHRNTADQRVRDALAFVLRLK